MVFRKPKRAKPREMRRLPKMGAKAEALVSGIGSHLGMPRQRAEDFVARHGTIITQLVMESMVFRERYVSNAPVRKGSHWESNKLKLFHEARKPEPSLSIVQREALECARKIKEQAEREKPTGIKLEFFNGIMANYAEVARKPREFALAMREAEEFLSA